MSFDETEIGSEVLDLSAGWDDWEEPLEFSPPPIKGTYDIAIAEIREVTGTNVVVALVDYEIVGGDQDKRRINFVRADSVVRERFDGTGVRSSALIDLFKSFGYTGAPPKNRDEIEKALNGLKDSHSLGKIDFDWRGFCIECYNAVLITTTGKADLDIAKDVASKEQKKLAGKTANKAKAYKQFPDNPKKPGTKVPYVICTSHGKVPAQGNVSRYRLKAASGSSPLKAESIGF